MAALAERSLPARGGLGLGACTALVVGNMIGSGIVLLPASLAALGPIYLDRGKPQQRAIKSATPDKMDEFAFPAGSMDPKVEAAQDFARATGKRAVICALADVPAAARGE